MYAVYEVPKFVLLLKHIFFCVFNGRLFLFLCPVTKQSITVITDHVSICALKLELKQLHILCNRVLCKLKDRVDEYSQIFVTDL